MVWCGGACAAPATLSLIGPSSSRRSGAVTPNHRRCCGMKATVSHHIRPPNRLTSTLPGSFSTFNNRTMPSRAIIVRFPARAWANLARGRARHHRSRRRRVGCVAPGTVGRVPRRGRGPARVVGVAGSGRLAFACARWGCVAAFALLRMTCMRMVASKWVHRFVASSASTRNPLPCSERKTRIKLYITAV